MICKRESPLDSGLHRIKVDSDSQLVLGLDLVINGMKKSKHIKYLTDKVNSTDVRNETKTRIS